MPLYDLKCEKCGKVIEVLAYDLTKLPSCCNIPMKRLYTFSSLKIKWGSEAWMNRMDDIHKAQEQRGERLRFVHPSEIL